MKIVRRLLAALFALCMVLALSQCGRRGTPSGGPKDETPPVLLRAEPPNRSTGFRADRIRLYFDEYIRLQNTEKQLIISPPLKYPPEISPMGGASKYLEIKFADTLLENTTYTLNFGQSVVDNNEGNPYNFLTYVFSTGDFIDSLSLSGVVADGFNRKADAFISVMLYEIDSSFTDSVVLKKPPYYMTNTLDSAVIFRLENLKAGHYRLIALKDEGKNNVFDPNADKIGFAEDTIVLPTEATYKLRLFKEIPKYSVRPPTYAAANKVLFGYLGEEAPEIELLTPLPDSVRTLVAPVYGKDSLNFWFTPWQPDSMQFALRQPGNPQRIDTFTVKPLQIKPDSLMLSWAPRNEMVPGDSLFLSTSIPLVSADTAFMSLVDQDTLAVPYRIRLDSLESRVLFDFPKTAEQSYTLQMLPGAVTDFFGGTNDTLITRWRVGAPTDFGVLKFSLQGALRFPLIVELTDNRENTVRRLSLSEPQEIEFNWLKPDTYRVRIIFDDNRNGRWDPGNFLGKVQPEEVVYYPAPIEIRANWEKVETFTIRE